MLRITEWSLLEEGPLEIIWSNYLLKQDCLEPTAQDYVQMAFAYPWGCRLQPL